MATNKAAKNIGEETVTIDRRRKDRRSDDSQAADGPTATNPPRRKKQRRRHIDPTTCERDYNEQEIEFMRAMDDYKRDSGRQFPTCSEVLEVVRNLGYVQLSDDQIDVLGIGLAEETEESFEGEVDELEEELSEV